MPFEIERKFLASTDVLAHCQFGTVIVQGYLFTDARNTIRIRRADTRAFLTWKGPKTGATREETEVEVPLVMGKALLAIVSDPARDAGPGAAPGPHRGARPPLPRIPRSQIVRIGTSLARP